MQYKTRLKEILDKKDKNQELTVRDIEDFNRIKRYINSKDYKSFCHAVKPERKWAWFQDFMMDELQETHSTDAEFSRILLRIADQHGKTDICGILNAAYILGKYPNKKILYITYSDKRAREPTAKLLEILISPEYQNIFPDFKLKDELIEERLAKKRSQKLSITNFTNANSPRYGKTGEFKAVGIEGSYLGYDADVIIVDDPFNGSDEAFSQSIRETRWNLFVGNILSRQQKHLVILVFATWWHEEDIVGKLDEFIKKQSIEGSIESQAPKWKLIEFNSLKDEREYPYDHRKIGEYLWAEERMNSYLDLQAISPLMWMTKHQNKPMRSGGSIFDATCFRYYDHFKDIPPLSAMRIVITMDPNYSKKAKNGDPAAIVVLGFNNSNVYLLEQEAINKVDVIDNCNRIKALMVKYPNYYDILVEKAAQGEAIETLLYHQGIHVNTFDPHGMSKVYRAQEMIPYCRAGQFFLPSPQLDASIIAYVNEFMQFTGFDGNKDDRVDATSQAFIHFKYLLQPLTLSKAAYSIRNPMNIGTGQTKLTNHFANGYGYGKKKTSYGSNFTARTV